MGPLTEKTRLDLEPLPLLPPELGSISPPQGDAAFVSSASPASPQSCGGCCCCRVGVTDPTECMLHETEIDDTLQHLWLQLMSLRSLNCTIGIACMLVAIESEASKAECFKFCISIQTQFMVKVYQNSFLMSVVAIWKRLIRQFL